MWSLECKHQMLTDDDGRRTTTDHNSSSCSGELITDDRSIQRMKTKENKPCLTLTRGSLTRAKSLNGTNWTISRWIGWPLLSLRTPSSPSRMCISWKFRETCSYVVFFISTRFLLLVVDMHVIGLIATSQKQKYF